MKSTPRPESRSSTRTASSRFGGSPQMPGPVRRIAPKPRRVTSRSPPIVKVPEPVAEIADMRATLAHVFGHEATQRRPRVFPIMRSDQAPHDASGERLGGAVTADVDARPQPTGSPQLAPDRDLLDRLVLAPEDPFHARLLARRRHPQLAFQQLERRVRRRVAGLGRASAPADDHAVGLRHRRGAAYPSAPSCYAATRS